MADEVQTKTTGRAEGGAKHPLQRLMDNPWLLLALGIVVPTLSYTVWGWLDVFGMSRATLP